MKTKLAHTHWAPFSLGTIIPKRKNGENSLNSISRCEFMKTKRLCGTYFFYNWEIWMGAWLALRRAASITMFPQLIARSKAQRDQPSIKYYDFSSIVLFSMT